MKNQNKISNISFNNKFTYNNSENSSKKVFNKINSKNIKVNNILKLKKTNDSLTYFKKNNKSLDYIDNSNINKEYNNHKNLTFLNKSKLLKNKNIINKNIKKIDQIKDNNCNTIIPSNLKNYYQQKLEEEIAFRKQKILSKFKKHLEDTNKLKVFHNSKKFKNLVDQNSTLNTNLNVSNVYKSKSQFNKSFQSFDANRIEKKKNIYHNELKKLNNLESSYFMKKYISNKDFIDNNKKPSSKIRNLDNNYFNSKIIDKNNKKSVYNNTFSKLIKVKHNSNNNKSSKINNKKYSSIIMLTKHIIK